MTTTCFNTAGTTSYIKVANTSTLNNMTNGITLYALIKPKDFYMGTCHGNYILSKGYFNNINNGQYNLRLMILKSTTGP